MIKAAAEDPKVERIFVNAAIKKALCREAGKDRAFLRKVRPWWGHNYHFHVRIGCPPGSPECKAQDPAADAEGCGKDLDYWFRPGDPQSAAAEGAAEAAPAAHDGGLAGGVQAGAGGAVERSHIAVAALDGLADHRCGDLIRDLDVPDFAVALRGEVGEQLRDHRHIAYLVAAQAEAACDVFERAAGRTRPG